MNLAIRIALRYLFAKKSQNIINVISMISVSGVLVGTMALVVVLSVFNGLHGLIGSLYESFDPELKVVPVEGKVFSMEMLPIEEIHATEGVDQVTCMLEDQALLRSDNRQVPAIVMGVDENFAKVSGIDTIIVEGKYKVKEHNINFGVAGYALADQLGLRLNFVKPLVVYAPKRTGQINMMRPDLSFNKEYLNPSGIFAVRQLEYDSKYLIINIEQARRLFDYQDDIVSSLGISVKEGFDVNAIKIQLQQLVGKHFNVLDRHEQHATFYKLMQVEKLMAYLILLFILVIAFFNIIGTLSLLIFEKKESIGTLKSMGATRSLINKIFLTEGWMISLLGVLGGGFLGAVLVWIQQQYGLLQFSGEGIFIVDAYPVELQWSDLVMVCLSVSIIGLLAAWYPVRVIVKSYYLGQGND
ncbi:ABC transporter permease [Thermophagus xiamenensis]|uniref:Lipoprotein-releasing system permease protein/zinc transport system substrate-binding protein n=1 Tax=Thermophagus xiamenensis TaxID=385682 RepID=A0A1I2E6P8_9BACT|nr:FtsX-like permease family protein [Thermophagus xiamenensis]SFE88148.1 lipoprotein-releasing system permease protein/zinc transport system substrate-binding protein [Thermophagus xiamenensis]